MESIYGDDINPEDGQEEKIFVSIRVRPLNAKEIAKNDSCDWECVSNNTIVCKNALTERSLHSNAYTFDRVFGGDITTRQVYEESARRVALTALNGINASIFAYGQTSSGKTYTMTGITQYAISDIFDHINKQIDREYVLKFSAIEIYNECVRDLLSADGTPLRLLDDPEKGTVVDKLTEIQLEDWTHLMELLAVCEAQRKIGETSLNEMSSRSHQIIRLTIESTPNEFSVISATTLAAAVNFIDLAGSERASQTKTAGKRLKEGGHINRSLLTLGTVVRKLGKGRNGHIPYRDSKLTRILQNSLGGNARTAMICTLSPAHTHLEQSRNTLLFAACAKDVRTTAQVNIVMSEKALVKQLQREMTRLGNELKNMSTTTNDSEAIIKEKEHHIQKMEQEVKELTQERDLARARLEEILRAAGVDQNLLPWVDAGSWDGGSVLGHLRSGSWDGSLASGHIRSGSWDGSTTSGHQHGGSWDEHSMSATSDLAVNTSDVAVNPILPSTASVNTYSFPKNHKLRNPNEDHYVFDNITPREFMNQFFGPTPTHDWEKPLQKPRTRTSSADSFKEVEVEEVVEEVIEKHEPEGDSGNSHLEDQIPPRTSPEGVTCSKAQTLTRSTSCSAIIEGDQSSSTSGLVSENNVVVESKSDTDIKNVVESKSDSDIKRLCRQDSQSSFKSVDEKEIQQDDGGIFDLSPSSRTLEKVMEYDIRRDKLVKGRGKGIESGDEKDWSLLFEEQRRKIIELWNECNIPLVHRTYFLLLIKGDPSDSVYIEVELRRLSFLKQTLDHVASARALTLERATLSRKLLSKMTPAERESLFVKWDIDLESKNRRFQLAQLLWTKTDDFEHIKESADIVAKLVGYVEPNTTPMELFSFSVAPKQEPQGGLFSNLRNALSLLRY